MKTLKRVWVRCARYDHEGDAHACARMLGQTGRFNVSVRMGADGRHEVWQRKVAGVATGWR